MYLKLTMPAVAGIPQGSNIPAHCAGFIVMRERCCCRVLQGCSHIRFWHERDIVFLHRLHELFGHAITLRAAHRCCAGLQIQLSGEPPRFMRGIRGTVVRQPLHRCVRQLIAEALFYRPQHYILHGRTVVATGTRRPVYGFSVATVQRERYPQFLAIVAAELEAVGAPPLVTFSNGHFPSMRPLRGRYCRFTLKQQRILTHDAVYAFGIDHRHVVSF